MSAREEVLQRLLADYMLENRELRRGYTGHLRFVRPEYTSLEIVPPTDEFQPWELRLRDGDRGTTTFAIRGAQESLLCIGAVFEENLRLRRLIGELL